MYRQIQTFVVLLFSLSIVLVSSVQAESVQAVYRVKQIPSGESLNMRAEPSQDGSIVVKIPHNARWIVKNITQSTPVIQSGWINVVWNQQEGWVRTANIKYDKAATELALQRRRCMQSAEAGENACCGYPAQPKGSEFHSVPIFRVADLVAGQVLFLKNSPSDDAATVVAIPHNASWIAKLHKEQQGWSYVRWAGQNGWVKSDQVEYDADTTLYGDRKRLLCGFSWDNNK